MAAALFVAALFAQAPAGWTGNAEMTAIFTADQAARAKPNIDWSVVGPEDGRRRARTKALLDAGKLESGDDY